MASGIVFSQQSERNASMMPFGSVIERLIGWANTAIMGTDMYLSFWAQMQKEWAVAGNYKQMQTLASIQAITGQDGFRPGLFRGVAQQYLWVNERLAHYGPMIFLVTAALAGTFWAMEFVSRAIMFILLTIATFFLVMWIQVNFIRFNSGEPFTNSSAIVSGVIFAVVVGAVLGFGVYNPSP